MTGGVIIVIIVLSYRYCEIYILKYLYIVMKRQLIKTVKHLSYDLLPGLDGLVEEGSVC